jgi:hypothetical protein
MMILRERKDGKIFAAFRRGILRSFLEPSLSANFRDSLIYSLTQKVSAYLL